MKSNLVAACALLAAATASVAFAAPAETPPPEGPDPDQIAQWVGRYIDKGTDVEAGVTHDMVLFYEPSTVRKTKQGVESVVRGEQFAVQVIPPGPIRSFRDVWRFDCAGRRFLLLESDIYPLNNLKGAPVRLDTSTERWSQSFPEGDGPGDLIAQICRDAGVAVGGGEKRPEDEV